MKIYQADNGTKKHLGSMQLISVALMATRQAVHKAYKNKTDCKGYKITFLYDKKPKVKKSIRANLSDSIDLLKRAKLIIDEENEAMSNRGEYSNIGIVEDIDRFLKGIK